MRQLPKSPEIQRIPETISSSPLNGVGKTRVLVSSKDNGFGKFTGKGS
ncbi:unnamed protein product [Tenebrio molitor]|nr:unnamed protein product [Tenebrio molitor]